MDDETFNILFVLSSISVCSIVQSKLWYLFRNILFLLKSADLNTLFKIAIEQFLTKGFYEKLTTY